MFSLILLAGGSSTRFGGDKLKALIGGVPVFLYSLTKFHKISEISEIFIVASENEIEDYKLLQKSFPKIKTVVKGGKERQYSVKNGLEQVTTKFVLVHNGANPLVSEEEILSTISATKEHGAAVVGTKVKNTIKKVNEGFVLETVPRADLYEVQTPQGLTTSKFKKLYEKYGDEVFTDDVSFFEREKLLVKIVEASEQNFKITTREDLQKMQSLIRPSFLTGFGHDSHKIKNAKIENGKVVKGKGLILGGVKISDELEFEGNSDGDVLIHSICNAIGTAIGEGSLSLYSDPLCKAGVTDSAKYFELIYSRAREKGYQVSNLAASIEGKRPKLEKHFPKIKENLAKLLSCTTFQIGLAATSGEELSSFGRGEGLQCFVSVVLKEI